MKTSKTKRPSSGAVKVPAWWPARLARLGLAPATKAERKVPGWYAKAGARSRAALEAVRLKAREEERKRVEAIEAKKPRCPLCNQKLNEAGLCVPCEEKMAMPYSMSMGGVHSVKDYDKGSKNPKYKVGPVVTVDKRVAERCRYLGHMALIKGQVCAFFHDDKTKTTYAQPVE